MARNLCDASFLSLTLLPVRSLWRLQEFNDLNFHGKHCYLALCHACRSWTVRKNNSTARFDTVLIQTDKENHIRRGNLGGKSLFASTSTNLTQIRHSFQKWVDLEECPSFFLNPYIAVSTFYELYTYVLGSLYLQKILFKMVQWASTNVDRYTVAIRAYRGTPEPLHLTKPTVLYIV